jgi:hypothetical protein
VALRLGPSRLALPGLELAEPAVLPAPAGWPVQTWPDPLGRVRVSAYRHGSSYWIDWPGVARFIVTPGTGVVHATPDPSSGPLTPSDVFDRFIVPLAWQAAGGEALHASAVCWGSSAVAFCASSGTGKSTIACGLGLRGLALLTDDGLLLDDAAVPAEVAAPTSDLRLRPESSAFFHRSATGPSRSVDLTGIPVASRGVLRGFVVLERLDDWDGLEMARLSGGQALAAILAHAHSIDPTDADLRARSVSRYLACLSDTPVWRLRYPSGFECMPRVLDLIEQTIEASL